MTQYQPSSLDRRDADVPVARRDDWVTCRHRATSILQTPELLLPWLFGLVFGIADAVLAGNSTGWIVAAALAAFMAVVVGADNIKFWVTLYPLVFLSPQTSLGSWAEGGEKQFGLQMYEPWILLLFCLWLPRLLIAKRLELPSNVKIVLGALLGIGLVGIWIAPDRLFALKTGVRTFFEPLFLFLLISSLPWKHAEIRRAVSAFLCVVTVAAGLSVLGYATGGGARGQGGIMRLDSYWEGANVFSSVLGAAIPTALGWALSASSRMAVMTGVAALLTAFAALVLTYSRGTWIGLVVALAFMTAQLRAWFWAGLVLMFIVAAVLAGPPHLAGRLDSIVNFEQDRSASNRLVLWPKVVNLIADRPLTGYGFAGFQVLFRKHPDIKAYHAHNVFLDFAVTLGIPALLLFLWLVGYVLLRTLAIFRRFRQVEDLPLLLGLCAAWIAMLAAGQFDGSIIVVWTIISHVFWLVLALTYAFTLTAERELRPF